MPSRLLFRRVRILLLTLIGLVFTGVAHADVVNINNEELASLIEQGVAVIDVRRADEWKQTGIIEGSETMTFFDEKGAYDARKWLSKLVPIADKDQPVVLICELGVRSKVIANFLGHGIGYSKVYNVTAGIDGWLKKGNPTVKVDSAE